ncbi:MAG: hypothetical protein JOY59_05505 [Candidatus Eremiobacteraeota bacterium]|nr:hypothetical protein [Candidatus Eremiobacteraeota bacterium]
METPLARSQAFALLRRFDVRVSEDREQTGTVAAIAGIETDDQGRVIALSSGGHFARRPLPLDEAEAESMLDAFSSPHAIGRDIKSRRTIAHLLLKLARLYAESGIERFGVMLHVRDDSYAVNDATIWAAHAVRVAPRLAAHAHDGAPRAFGFHPKRQRRLGFGA